MSGDPETEGALWGFKWREAETEFARERPPRVFLLERKSSKDFLMRQLRYFWDQWWSLLRTEKQMFEFTDGSHQNRFVGKPRGRLFTSFES